MITVTYYVGIEDKGKNMISQTLFRKNSGKYWNILNENISELTALTGTGQDFAPAQSKILNMVRGFGDLVRQVYGATAEMEVDTGIQGMIAGLFEAIALIENEVDTANLTNRVASNTIANLCNSLNSLNSNWSPSITTPIFVNMWTAWLAQATAKLNNDQTAFDQAKETAKGNGSAFSDAFVTGVIQQYAPIFF